MDQISLDRLKKLHPKVRENAIAAYTQAAEQLTGRAMLRVTFGGRSFAEQHEIYLQGRDKAHPGPIVTNADAGASFHNYYLAFDIALVIDGKTASWDTKTDWDNDKKSDWMECVAIFQKFGWEWGGSWTSFKDMPHFQMVFGYSWKQLLALHKAGKVDKDGYVLI